MAVRYLVKSFSFKYRAKQVENSNLANSHALGKNGGCSFAGGRVFDASERQFGASLDVGR